MQRVHANPLESHPNDLTSSSKVSGEDVQHGSQERLLKSTLTPRSTIEMYLEDDDKLKVALEENFFGST